MDMNEFEGNSELGPVRSSHEANAGEFAAPEMKDALHDEIRALRRQLERLQAFQPARHPEQEESPEELPDEEADIDQPDNSALAKPPRRWSPSRIALALLAAESCASADFNFGGTSSRTKTPMMRRSMGI